ncbi:MAG: DNA repair protein [Lachnospiraceae bacterium]|jgi:DNA polymerase V|nr:DNA repair protein [Lachnospiraceae bacterium]
MEERMYLCIDLKSFYACVECVERGLDPMTSHLVVADPKRSEKTICLAISPSLKALGIKNRCRVFQIPKNIKYIMAPPRMKRYMDYSADIYAIYLKYIAKEDIHVYSIDEVFLDVTPYLSMYQLTAKELAVTIMEDIKNTTGIPATAGIGTNLYLAKVALDITAKHVEDNIGYLDEKKYQKTLWNHRPITDFWRVGKGTKKRLESIGIMTMKDITLTDENILYQMFGVDAELLIDHAWGRETTTMEDIKAYKPKKTSLTRSQVLKRDYSFEECTLIIKEMIDALCLDMLDKNLVTQSISLIIEYSREMKKKPAVGTRSIRTASNSYSVILPYVLDLYEGIVQRDMPIRKVNISYNHIVEETYEQYELFKEDKEEDQDRKLQKAVLEIKKRFGKNALIRGMDLQEGGTARERNEQIGGHRSGESHRA